MTDIAGQPPRPVTPISLIVAELERLSLQAAAFVPGNTDFSARLHAVTRLASGLDPYVEACTTPESSSLAKLTERTQQEAWDRRFADGETAVELEQEMVSGHVEGQLLKMLVHATRAASILEIGLFTGYSALAMAEALPEGGRLVALEIDAFAANFARTQFASAGLESKIRVEVGPAKDSLLRLIQDNETFDLVFIDADKGSYGAYLDIILESSLLSSTGLVCVDNTLMQGDPWCTGARSENGDAIARFNRQVADDARVEQVLIPIRDGLTLIRRA